MKTGIFFLIFCFGINVLAESEAKESQQQEAGDKKTENQAGHKMKVQTDTDGQMTDDKETGTRKTMNGNKKEFQKYVITANLGINVSYIKNIESPGFGLMLGGKYSFYFSSKVGVFAGLDYMQRNASENNWNFKLTSIDIPFGLAFRYKNWFDSSGTTFLGLYYNLPQGGKVRYTGPLSVKDGSLEVKGEKHFGFLFHSETYFEVAESFNLGFFCGLKFGFGDYITRIGRILQPDNNNTWDIMLGVTAKF